MQGYRTWKDNQRTMKTLRWEGYFIPKKWIQFVLFLSFLIASAVWKKNSLLEEANSFPEEANATSVGRNYFLRNYSGNSLPKEVNVSSVGRNYSLPKEASVSSVVRNSVLPVKYGFVHMARSGGSVLNHLLALKYERVCGNKGYSYNENAKNEKARRKRSEGSADLNLTALAIANQKKRFSNSTHRQNTPDIMIKRGFDKCDYIAMEVPSTLWRKIIDRHRPLEMHIPCRDPIDHLMSMCAFRYKHFHCDVTNKELQIQVDGCIQDVLERFSMDMAPSPNFTMKCFSSPSKIDGYIEYMGKKLQKKQIQDEYFVPFNKWLRHKETECIWEKANTGLRKRLEELLMNHKSQYFKYCKDCIGSEHDLLR